MLHYMKHGLLRSIPWLVLAGCLFAQYTDVSVAQFLRLKAFDVYQKSFPRPVSDTPVYVIDIDEKSLDEVGQWPWPRDVIAELVDKSFGLGLDALGFDVVFPESDGKSPEIASKNWMLSDEMKQSLKLLPANDDVLASAFKNHDVTLGFAFLFTGDKKEPGNLAPKRNLQFIPDSTYKKSPNEVRTEAFRWLREPRSAERNIPVLEEAADSMGWFGYPPDVDNIIRRIPLLVKYGPYETYPALGLELLRYHLNITRSPRVVVTEENGLEQVQFLKRRDIVKTLPVDQYGNYWIWYRKYQTPEVIGKKYISASDILFDRLDPQFFDGAIALVGATATGLYDLRTTPLDPLLPGVDIHVQFLETAMEENFLIRDPRAAGVEFFFTLFSGALLILLLEYLGAFGSSVVLVTLLSTVISFCFYIFRTQGYLMDWALPSVTILSCFVVQNVMKYAREEASRKAIRSAFSHYLSPDLVRILSRNPEKLSLGGEERDMTILFCDIRSFTSISEGLTPERLTRLLNEYLTPMTDIIQKHGGTIDKYMGDAIMAFWNAPLDTPEHQLKASMAALEMLEQLHDLNEVWVREGLPEIRIGIGINTGRANVGNMGSEQRFDYTVMGDSVNLASRLEGISKLYGVSLVVSESVKEKVPEGVFVPLDLVMVKGKTEPVAIFELIAVGADFDKDALKEVNDISSAIDAYRTKDWDLAKQYFLTLKTHSVMKSLYMERIISFEKSPPPKDWDGVYVATSK